MSYSIREMRKEEYSLLSDFLYEAIYIPDGTAAPPKSVITCPELQVYIADFGNSKHDKALIVEVDGNIVGAIWARIMNDYGHYMKANGYELDITDTRYHHEIYLSDPRKCDVSRLKTVVRHPIRKTE